MTTSAPDDAQLELDNNGLPRLCRDREGTTAWTLRWAGRTLVHAEIRLPRGDLVDLVPAAGEHALLGPCDLLRTPGGITIARIAAVDWASPASIPGVDVPGALAPGTGTAVLNLIARLAAAAARDALRYRGPWPTHALLASLRSSFVVADANAAAHAFTEAADSAQFGLAACSPAIDFVPSPHAWAWTTPRTCAQRRGGRLERVWIDGRAYDARGEHARLVIDGDRIVARVVFAGTTWCEVATFDDTGVPLAAIAEPTPPEGDWDDVALPTALVEVLAQAIAADAPAPLRPAVHEVFAAGIRLADLGLDPARMGEAALRLHAGLVDRAAALPPAASLGTLAAAVRPVALAAAAARVAAAWAAK